MQVQWLSTIPFICSHLVQLRPDIESIYKSYIGDKECNVDVKANACRTKRARTAADEAFASNAIAMSTDSNGKV
jgi:hypothetical protein